MKLLSITFRALRPVSVITALPTLAATHGVWLNSPSPRLVDESWATGARVNNGYVTKSVAPDGVHVTVLF